MQGAVAFNPDIVILLFGTNDAKQTHFNADTFESDYIDLIDLFITHANPSTHTTDTNEPLKQRKVTFFIGVPPPVIPAAFVNPSGP